MLPACNQSRELEGGRFGSDGLVEHRAVQQVALVFYRDGRLQVRMIARSFLGDDVINTGSSGIRVQVVIRQVLFDIGNVLDELLKRYWGNF